MPTTSVRRLISPLSDAIVRLIGDILLEQNDEWAVQRARYMTHDPGNHRAPRR